MKKTKIYLLMMIISFLLVKCERGLDDGRFTFRNESDKDIIYYLADRGFVYPDTTLQTQVPIDILKKKEQRAFSGFKKQDREFIFLFVFDPDTINKYSWERIREDYKILKRYKLNLNEIREGGYVVTYP